MQLKAKKIWLGNRYAYITLTKFGSTYRVMCDEETFYQGTNKVFAAQRFNEI